MDTEDCNSCHYFKGGDALGQCRRFPTYQNRHKNEWCGEYTMNNDCVTSMVNVLTNQVNTEEPKRRGRPRHNV
jgi:hypothetical protein